MYVNMHQRTITAKTEYEIRKKRTWIRTGKVPNNLTSAKFLTIKLSRGQDSPTT